MLEQPPHIHPTALEHLKYDERYHGKTMLRPAEVHEMIQSWPTIDQGLHAVPFHRGNEPVEPDDPFLEDDGHTYVAPELVAHARALPEAYIAVTSVADGEVIQADNSNAVGIENASAIRNRAALLP